MGRIRSLWVLLGLVLFTVSIYDFHVSADVTPSENECRPYIEKAIHELKNVESAGSDEKESTEANVDDNDSIEAADAVPDTGTDDDGNESTEDTAEKGNDNENDGNQSQETQTDENDSGEEKSQDEAGDGSNQDDDSKEQNESVEGAADDKSAQETDNDSKEQAEDDGDSKETPDKDDDSKEQTETNADIDSKEEATGDDNDSKENTEEDEADSKADETEEGVKDDDDDSKEANDSAEAGGEKSGEEAENQTAEDDGDSKENDDQGDSNEVQDDTKEDESVEEKVRVKRSTQSEAGNEQSDEKEEQESAQNDDSKEADDDSKEGTEDDGDSKEAETTDGDSKEADGEDSKEEATDAEDSKEADGGDSKEETAEGDSKEETDDDKDDSKEDTKDDGDDSKEAADKSDEEGTESKEDEEESPEEDLTMIFEIPKNLRPHDHVDELLGLDAESSIKENALRRTGDFILKDLKKVFDNAIKPLETLYKYRDLSNRHFGDPEIFSKPLVLFMGPWSGGKSTILNYLTGNEYTPHSIRSGAEPSPAYFNILMHGDEPEVLDGTQLAADWTFSGLQKFGQGLMDRLRGQKLPNKLLERVNIVEIPGILEVRKQVSRYFPFNDACQWFIDRADIIFLVYDPSKLDVGPETEAILDQLKGREYQTRILLNKADQVKPEELLRVQGALIWNISPLMSSAQPPVMYTVSLWSHPYTSGAPVRLLQAQERAFLSDLREAIDKRIENKIASARRFAVRIRNHAKMVDCYLTTYYNQKGLFSNKKQVADKIIEHPQNYNIYEGLSTLTNISRYDLPDPEVYLDFFRLNPLFEFKKLSETCTYFKGCPINKLDIAIAYELPELVGKYKKMFEQNLADFRKEYEENCNQSEPEPPMKIIKSR